MNQGKAPAGELPAVIITGASGFLGRHLVAALRDRYRIFGLGRRSHRSVGIPDHHHLSWFQADIAEREALEPVFRSLRQVPGPKVLIHLAAYYDFTGEKSPEYERTNVHGLRNVLELSRALRPERFVFASSVAACDFPPPGAALDEESPADGDHHYAVSKRRGEELLRQYAGEIDPVIVRLGALFSDWCEYPPLYTFLGTWLSQAWKRRMLAGRGLSAVPYLHVRCAARFFARIVEKHRELRPCEVAIASTDGCVSHLETFEAATLAFHGYRMRPIFTPKLLARLGLNAMDLAGRLTGNRPFERPWMGRYIDLRLNTDAARTRARVGWAPNPRLAILRRIPFLVENMKSDPIEWHRRNLAAMRTVEVQPNLRLLQLLEVHEREILETSVQASLAPEAVSRHASYQTLGEDEVRWAKRQLFLQLKNTIRARDIAIFKAYCRYTAERRYRQGFPCGEVCHMIAQDRDTCLRILSQDPGSRGLEDALRDHVVMTFMVGLDEILDAYEELSGEMVAVDP